MHAHSHQQTTRLMLNVLIVNTPMLPANAVLFRENTDKIQLK